MDAPAVISSFYGLLCVTLYIEALDLENKIFRRLEECIVFYVFRQIQQYIFKMVMINKDIRIRTKRIFS